MHTWSQARLVQKKSSVAPMQVMYCIVPRDHYSETRMSGHRTVGRTDFVCDIANVQS